MKKFKILFLALMLLPAISCSVSTEDLAEEVKASIEETYSSNGYSGVAIESVMLTHKGGNEYTGIVKTLEEGVPFQYTVEVIYDGNYIKWEIKD